MLTLLFFSSCSHPCGEPPGLRNAHRDGVVLLLQQVGADDLVHVPQGGVILGSDHQPFGAAVQPVADAGLEAVLTVGIVFALLGQVLGKGIHQIGVTGTVAVAQQMGGLVQHRKIFVLVDDRYLGLIGLLFGGSLLHRLCALGREELVVDVQLDQVSRLQTVLRCGLFAVHLHPLVAETFVQQAGGKIAGHALHKAGKTNAVVVGGCGILFHKCSSIFKRYLYSNTALAASQRGNAPDQNYFTAKP